MHTKHVGCVWMVVELQTDVVKLKDNAECGVDLYPPIAVVVENIAFPNLHAP
ncbi:hypothetical protein BaRGS_00008356, partial [Batillaria attramentaria]